MHSWQQSPMMSCLSSSFPMGRVINLLHRIIQSKHKEMSHLGAIKKSSQISHANRLVGLIKYLLILISSVDSTGETRSAADMRFDLLDSSIQSAADLQQEGLNGRRGKGPQSKIFSVGSSLRRRSLQPLVGSMNGRSFSVRKGSSSE